MNAAAIRWPSSSGCGEVLQHVHQAHDRADDADGGRVGAGVGEELAPTACPRRAWRATSASRMSRTSSGSVPSMARVTPLTRNGSSTLLQRVLQRQQALAAGLLGERDHDRARRRRPARTLPVKARLQRRRRRAWRRAWCRRRCVTRQRGAEDQEHRRRRGGGSSGCRPPSRWRRR